MKFQEFVERNIRQLVIDDEDIQDDPAIVNVRKARPIPRVRITHLCSILRLLQFSEEI